MSRISYFGLGSLTASAAIILFELVGFGVEVPVATVFVPEDRATIPLFDADQFSRLARVTRVVDSDTFDVEVELLYSTRHLGRVRVLGYDGPELTGVERDAGIQAKQMLTKLIGSEPVVLTGGLAKDSFGRWLCVVRLADGRDPVELLLDAGYGRRMAR